MHLAVLSDLIPRAKVRGVDTEDVAAIKGSSEMEHIVRRAIRDRQRPIRENLRIRLWPATTFPYHLSIPENYS